MIFADELYHHFFPRDFVEVVAAITRDTQVVANWACENGLKLNIKKTKAIVFDSQAYISSLDLSFLPKIIIDGEALSFVNEVRNLDVLITCTLDWKSDVHAVLRKVDCILYILRFHRYSVSKHLTIDLIERLVFPQIDYTCVIYRHLDGE